MDRKEFIVNTAMAALGGLKAERQPIWGIMTAQHMVEHLCWTFKVSSGKVVMKLHYPEERLPGMRRFLYSDKPLMRNFKAPFLPAGQLPELVHPDLGEALRALTREIDDFFAFFRENPDATPVHPTFGPLNSGEWERFHEKHLTHHLEQFGLIAARETG